MKKLFVILALLGFPMLGKAEEYVTACRADINLEVESAALPVSVWTNCVFWMDASAGVYNAGTTNFFVPDLSTNRNDATQTVINSQPTITADGIVFDGVDDYSYKSLSGFRSNDYSGTLSFWSSSSADHAFSSADENSISRYLIFNEGRILWDAGSQYSSITANWTRSDTNFHHFAFVSSGSALKIYVDGVETALTINSGSNNGTWFGDVPDRDNIVIGARKRLDGLGGYVNGTIRSLKIFSNAFSSNDVERLFNGGL